MAGKTKTGNDGIKKGNRVIKYQTSIMKNKIGTKEKAPVFENATGNLGIYDAC